MGPGLALGFIPVINKTLYRKSMDNEHPVNLIALKRFT
jgi:hypothetical protein